MVADVASRFVVANSFALYKPGTGPGVLVSWIQAQCINGANARRPYSNSATNSPKKPLGARLLGLGSLLIFLLYMQ